jgi:septal ring factor EnvC (AmiA/AmiB activator)
MIGSSSALCILILVAPAAAVKTEVKFSANPIRRVVNMLQMMQKKVESEGEKSKELFEKFQCYCKNNNENLAASIGAAEDKIPQLESDIKGSSELQAQLESELAGHKADRSEAKEAVAKATAIREKEANSFAAESAEQKTNIAALGKAIPAIEKGMGGDFLQTSTATQLKVMMSTSSQALETMSGADRELLSNFLSGSQQDSDMGAGTAEILGIMKQLKEEMEADLAEMIKTEEDAVAEYDSLVAAKEKEIAAATKAIEEKIKRKGDVAVELADLKEDLDDTSQSLAEDKKMLAALVKECDTKTKEYEAQCKTRSQELLAISDTIKMLNDDDALDLFKKTLPGSAAAFVEVGASASELRQQALETLRGGMKRHRFSRDYRVNFLALAMQGKKVGFDKVLGMIDGMVELLGKEQIDDDKKKAYCANEFDKVDDEIKALTGTIGDLDSAIEEQKETLATVVDEIKKLSEGIVELDRSVAAATAQRKEEHAEFTETLAANNAAIQLIEMAKNRMNKFYNPKLYKAPPKREMSEEERITLNMGGTLAPTNPPGGIAGTGISAIQDDDALSFAQVKSHRSLAPGAGEESTGVIAMMDMLIQDVKKEVQEMEFGEKDAQSEYETMVSAAEEKRTTDKKAVEEKEGVKAGLEEELHKLATEKKSRSEELMDTKMYLSEVHEDCDWLLENYETRKEARANEVDAMKKAKAVLSGADYSLVQIGVRHHLRQR